MTRGSVGKSDDSYLICSSCRLPSSLLVARSAACIALLLSLGSFLWVACNSSSQKFGFDMMKLEEGAGLLLLPQQLFLSRNESAVVKERLTTALPSLIGNQVFLLDAVWVPPDSKLVLLALAPKMFHDFNHGPEFHKKHSKAYNLTFPFENLKSPMALVPQLSWDQKPVQSCQQISTSSNDGNIHNRLFIVHCQVDSTSQTGVHSLRYQENEVARFDWRSSTFNAATSMVFDRTAEKDTDRNDIPLNSSSRLSILIKPVSNYSPLFPDLIDYYWRQGVRHVYVGLIHPDKESYDSYRRILREFPGFVSFGWFNSTDVAFDYKKKQGHILLKIMFANSVLYHTKAAGDDLLMVVDIDEVPVSMRPTGTSFVDAMSEQVDNETCSGVLHSHRSWSFGDKNSTKIGKRFPFRCETLNGYMKSVAVLKNCDFVGIHLHGACANGTKRKDFNTSEVTMHHYTSWWGRIRQLCAAEVESELAKYQKEVVTTTRD